MHVIANKHNILFQKPRGYLGAHASAAFSSLNRMTGKGLALLIFAFFALFSPLR
jgi:hypothetical protein